ncbi:hypothetical protein Tco_0047365 [Tanacetum coccineum]
MTEKIYDDVMQVLEDALPPDSKLVGSFYETKKFASDLSLLCEKINSCINGCMLYWGEEDKDLWHDEHVQEDGVISHPFDAEAWKHFDQTYPPFAAETRNVRLGLCTDGFQPFGQSGKQYSCWPVIERNFTMRAALLWTINDFPAYRMLSGWSTARKKACPYCMENSKAFSLSNGGKNRVELSQSSLTLTGEQVIEQIDEFELKEVIEIGGAEFNASISKSCGWRKRNIFWNLPYWSTNLIRHNLDVMHIEKNMFENVFEMVMDIEGKTKDNAKARDDVKIYCKRKELEKNESTGKYPKTCYSLGKEEKKAVCDWVAKLKFPDGYVLNMTRCVDMKKYKMFVWKALTELSLFFKDLTCTMIEMDDMIRLQTEIPVILCKLENIFSPGFFDSMEHLPVHFP